MYYLIAFSIAFGFSFLGMLAPGLINMKLVAVSFKRGIKSAFLFAIGASSVEFFQALLSLHFADLCIDFFTGNIIVQWSAVVLLLALSISFLLAKPKKQKFEEKQEKHSSLINGILISMLNIIVYPFWMAVGIYYMDNGIIKNEWDILIIFSLGAMLGTFTAYLIYIKLGNYIMTKFDSIAKNLNLILAVIFLILAIIQSLKTIL